MSDIAESDFFVQAEYQDKISPVSVLCYESVGDLKCKIAKELEILPDSVKLFLFGEQLDENLKIEETKLSDSCKIEIRETEESLLKNKLRLSIGIDFVGNIKEKLAPLKSKLKDNKINDPDIVESIVKLIILMGKYHHDVLISALKHSINVENFMKVKIIKEHITFEIDELSDMISHAISAFKKTKSDCSLNIVCLFLDMSDDVNLRFYDAVKTCDISLVKEFTKRGASLSSNTDGGWSVFKHLISSESYCMIRQDDDHHIFIVSNGHQVTEFLLNCEDVYIRNYCNKHLIKSDDDSKIFLI